MLKKGATFTLDDDKTPGDENRVYLPHPEILAALEPGHTLLLDDGKVKLIAVETSVKARRHPRRSRRQALGAQRREPARHQIGSSAADREGPLRSRGLSRHRRRLVGALVHPAAGEDMAEAKKITRGRAAVMAKIEKPQAVARLAEIMDFTDGLMVARGDLGVEMPLEKSAGHPEADHRMARRAGKPVVVATQMLESMITNPVPTRAEVSDVATAIFEGADAVMLSAESAPGNFRSKRSRR